jgi:hypothetical protein
MFGIPPNATLTGLECRQFDPAQASALRGALGMRLAIQNNGVLLKLWNKRLAKTRQHLCHFWNSRLYRLESSLGRSVRGRTPR